MSLRVLFLDELRGFYLSKVMLFLWVGMPVLALVLYLWSPDPGSDIALSALVALLVSSLSGTLAAVMLVVSIINERNAHVYDLFVIRPIRRRDILLAKYMAVFMCVQIAAVLAFAVGIGFDHLYRGTELATLWGMVADSIVMSVVILAISSAAGILIGTVSPSIMVGAILVIYLGNQIAGGMGAITALYLDSNAAALALGAAVAAVLLGISVTLFDRRQL